MAFIRPVMAFSPEGPRYGGCHHSLCDCYHACPQPVVAELNMSKGRTIAGCTTIALTYTLKRHAKRGFSMTIIHTMSLRTRRVKQSQLFVSQRLPRHFVARSDTSVLSVKRVRHSLGDGGSVAKGKGERGDSNPRPLGPQSQKLSAQSS